MCEYFEGTHNDLFNEAHAFYKEVKEKYPQVKDVTKTQEFMSRVTPNVPIPYYYLKRQRANTQKSSHLMQLQIPLLNVEELQRVATPTTGVSDSNVQELQASMDVQDVAACATTMVCVSGSNVQELQASIDVQDVAACATTTACVSGSNVQELHASMDVQDVAADTTLPLLSSDVYEALMNEIRQDPDLMRILNDFPDFNDIQPDDELESINPLVWHDAQPNDISALEKELLNNF